MNTYGGVDVELHAFLTSALDGIKWSASRLDRFTPEQIVPATHWLEGLAGPKVGGDEKKFLPCR
jgi:hypothetical protein